MKVQNFLKNGGTLEDLKEQYGIKSTFHPELPLVILNYNQIDSPKTEPIVMECRGLTLELNTWEVVARSYDRFFNLGEHQELTNTFNWNSFECYTKEDGSLMVLYNYKGEWMVNTRGSFALDECNFSGKTWSELFFELLEKDIACSVNQLYPGLSYIFEMWSPFNKIVRQYEEPQVILTGIRCSKTGVDLSGPKCDFTAEACNIRRPTFHQLYSLREVEYFLQDQEEKDPTFEGVVVRDINGLRLKIKSKTYLALHRLCDNGNMYNPKNLVPFVLAGETDELLTYFPEVKDCYHEVENKINEAFEHLKEVFRRAKDIEDQKTFALFITKKFPTQFSGILFSLKKKYGMEATVKHLEEVWRQSGDMIVKFLYQ
jgi:T4 RnlA family RNA ligase